MTRERIKDFKEVVLPFFTNYFSKENYENLGKSDAEEFKKDFNEIIELADKALEQRPCGDTISRSQALKELAESAKHHANDSREEVLLRRDREIIRALPPVTPTQRWIPVSEKLPEDFQRVLVTIVNYKGDKVVRVSEYYNRVFRIKENHERWGVGEKGLLAWAPLPEPYKDVKEQ